MLRGVFKNIPRNIIVIALVALFSGLGQDMIAPILPAYFLALGFDRAVIGLIDGLLQGVTHIFKFVSGIISDRLNSRKGLVFFGYALSSIARPLLALTSVFSGIAGARILDGIGKGMKDAPRDALIADSASETNTGRAFGFHRFLDTIGSVIGPVIATALLLYFGGTLTGYKTIFALTAIPGVIVLLLIIFGIRESKHPLSSPPPRGGESRFGIYHKSNKLSSSTGSSLFLIKLAHFSRSCGELIKIMPTH